MSAYVSLLKRIRKKCRLKQVDMAKAMRLDQHAYMMAERSRKRFALPEVVQLFDIYRENGGDLESFWKVIEISARRDK